MKKMYTIEKATSQEQDIFNLWKGSRNTAINLAFGLKTESLDVERLTTAINCIIARHDRLRSNFFEKDGVIYRCCKKTLSICVHAFTSKNLQDFIQPFDLEEEPLIRVAFFQDTILFDICHIVTDGFSMAIFFSELNNFYSGIDVLYQPPPIVVADELLVKQNTAFWSQQFVTPYKSLILPRNKDGITEYGGDGNSMIHHLDSLLTRKVQRLCAQLCITQFVYYFSAFLLFLYKECQSSDIVTATNLSCRSGKTIRSIGLLAKTVPVRFKIAPDMTIEAFLQSVDEYVRAAVEHQHFDCKKLFLDCNVSDIRDFSRTLFTYEPPKIANVYLDNKPCTFVPIPSRYSKTDFTICFFPFKQTNHLLLFFRSDLFSFQRARKYLRCYVAIIKKLLTPNCTIEEIMEEI
ncbi:MAG: hypothetical protein K6E51_07105 [Treponema sp.]|nr:hypothetical protein [Treponema sp.]